MCPAKTRKTKKRNLPECKPRWDLDVYFPQWKPRRNHWRLLINRKLYLSPWSKSIPFKVEKSETKRIKSQEWRSFNLFESDFVKREKSCVIFTGGPVRSSAWCPVPVQEASQYIALSCSFSEGYVSYACTHARKGLLQLWNFGSLLKSKLEHRPEMELALHHNHGEVLDMAWCPKGCWDKPEESFSDEHLPRLGLLAVACSDSIIRIYSIPHPKYLTNSLNPVFYSWSEVMLHPLSGPPASFTEKSACCCLSWQVANDCEQIAGGYSNGMIFVWKIDTKSTLCVSSKSRKIITPYLAFQAYGDPVSSIHFTPHLGGRVIASYNIERNLQLWDLHDTRIPILTHKFGKLGYSRDAKWATIHSDLFHAVPTTRVKVFHTLDHFAGEATYKNNGVVMPSLVSSSPSELLKAVALSDFKGSVYINAACHSPKAVFKVYKLFDTNFKIVDRSEYENLISNEKSEIRELNNVENLLKNNDSPCNLKKELVEELNSNILNEIILSITLMDTGSELTLHGDLTNHQYKNQSQSALKNTSNNLQQPSSVFDRANGIYFENEEDTKNVFNSHAKVNSKDDIKTKEYQTLKRKISKVYNKSIHSYENIIEENINGLKEIKDLMEYLLENLKNMSPVKLPFENTIRENVVRDSLKLKSSHSSLNSSQKDNDQVYTTIVARNYDSNIIPVIENGFQACNDKISHASGDTNYDTSHMTDVNDIIQNVLDPAPLCSKDIFLVVEEGSGSKLTNNNLPIFEGVISPAQLKIDLSADIEGILDSTRPDCTVVSGQNSETIVLASREDTVDNGTSKTVVLSQPEDTMNMSQCYELVPANLENIVRTNNNTLHRNTEGNTSSCDHQSMVPETVILARSENVTPPSINAYKLNTNNVSNNATNQICDQHSVLPHINVPVRSECVTSSIAGIRFDTDSVPDSSSVAPLNNQPVMPERELNKVSSTLADSKCSVDCEFLELAELKKNSPNHGLVFKDFKSKISKNSVFKLSDDDHSLSALDQCSITSVAWNPNDGNQHWLFSAGHSGLARLHGLHKMFEQHNKKEKQKRKRKR